jgi:hypothetical protein
MFDEFEKLLYNDNDNNVVLSVPPSLAFLVMCVMTIGLGVVVVIVLLTHVA